MTSIQNLSGAFQMPQSTSIGANPFAAVDKNQAAEQVASEFESVFTSIMLKEMRKTLEPGSLFGEDSSDIYGGMFDQFLGQHMASSGGIGLASMVRQALAKASHAEQNSISAKSVEELPIDVSAAAK